MTISSKIILTTCLATCLGMTYPLQAKAASYNGQLENIPTLEIPPKPYPLKKPPLSPPQNQDNFMATYQQLAAKGDSRAQITLGQLYLDQEGGNYKPELAFKWFHKAAKAGNKLAQFNVGSFYQQGLGTKQDDQKALKWFLRVVEQDTKRKENRLAPEILAWTQLKLGIIYSEGKGVPTNYSLAMKWFKKATDENHAYGQYLTGLLHAEGRGVSKDNQRAIFWLKAAAAQGLKSAQSELELQNMANDL
jgi:uncharacterized protein